MVTTESIFIKPFFIMKNKAAEKLQALVTDQG